MEQNNIRTLFKLWKSVKLSVEEFHKNGVMSSNEFLIWQEYLSQIESDKQQYIEDENRLSSLEHELRKKKFDLDCRESSISKKEKILYTSPPDVPKKINHLDANSTVSIDVDLRRGFNARTGGIACGFEHRSYHSEVNQIFRDKHNYELECEKQNFFDSLGPSRD